MPLITLEQDAAQAIKSLLADKGAQRPIRIELQFTGCCDPSLGLLVDAARASDLVEEVDGLTFVIDRETRELAGEVSIAYREEEGRPAFVVTSSNPVGEWDGLITCDLRL